MQKKATIKIKNSIFLGGFSLIEVSVAAAVIAISLVGLTKGAIQYNRAAEHQTKVTQAIACLETVSEELLGTSDADPRLTSGTHSEEYNHQGRIVASNGFFKVEWRVQPGVPFAGQRRVTLSASWDETGGKHSVNWSFNRR